MPRASDMRTTTTTRTRTTSKKKSAREWCQRTKTMDTYHQLRAENPTMAAGLDRIRTLNQEKLTRIRKKNLKKKLMEARTRKKNPTGRKLSAAAARSSGNSRFARTA